mgnify:CR=1 FL=1
MHLLFLNTIYYFLNTLLETLLHQVQKICIAFVIAVILFVPFYEVSAKRPPEIRNQEDLNITSDMHGMDLSGYEFVKFDLRGIDFSESNLTGAVFNNSQMNDSDLHGADLKDALAYATDFENANLSDVNFTNDLLMESSFKNAFIARKNIFSNRNRKNF